jgi:hypothetical protein
VVGLYFNPPDKAVVLCVDEKSSVQALDFRAHGGSDQRSLRPTARLWPPILIDGTSRW